VGSIARTMYSQQQRTNALFSLTIVMFVLSMHNFGMTDSADSILHQQIDLSSKSRDIICEPSR
jgi:hypothetical protein